MRRLLGVAWLTLVWVLLWGTVTPATVVGGVLVALLVRGAFGRTSTLGGLPLRPVPLLRLVGYVARDVVVSTIEVSWQVLRHGPASRGAIVALPLLTRSEPVVAVLANALTLSPGTLTLEIDVDSRVWYVYALGPRDRAAVERARCRSMDMQRRVLAAFGTAAELAQAQRWTPEAPG